MSPHDKKEFHNPGILEMLMSQYNILEKGSNYPTVCRRRTALPTLPLPRVSIPRMCATRFEQNAAGGAIGENQTPDN